MGGEVALAAACGAAVALLILAGMHKLGTTGGLFAPLALPLLLVLLANPLWMTTAVVGAIVVLEGPDFGLFSFGAGIYSHRTLLNVLVALVVLSVAIELVRARRRLWIPQALRIPLGLLLAAIAVGAITSHSSGVSFLTAIRAENVLIYLLLLPIAIANLDLEREQVVRMLQGWIALGALKGLLGVIEVAAHLGVPIEGQQTLTYYEPTANWIVMISMLAVLAAALSGYRPPLWMLVSAPLLVASLVLSYRRSFWIGSVLGAVLVAILALSPSRRRILIPAVVFIAAAFWLADSVNLEAESQSPTQSPIVHRIESLEPSKLTSNVEDRYRLDERANVLAAIGRNPIAGAGLFAEWSASTRPLPIEHEGGRLYVHFDALWFWFKLGILGLLAYLSLLAGTALLSWRVWHSGREPLTRAYGLACLCGVAGLAVIETTGSFTGVDTRFTILLAAQIGGLALLARRASTPDAAPAPAPAEVQPAWLRLPAR
jgi:hypothetical protein